MYRIIYHWFYTTDDQRRRIGLSKSIENGILDLTKKSITILMKDFVKASATKDGTIWKADYARTMSDSAGEEVTN